MSRHARGFRQLPSEKDALFPLANIMRGTTGQTPVSKVWRPGPHLNQGPTNSCVGHATFQFQASEPRVMVPPKLGPFDIYGEARKIDEFPGELDAGTSIRAGLNVLRREGVIRAYYWALDAEQVLEYLLTYGPVVIGTSWPKSMDTVDANGFVRPKGKSVIGHAYFAYAAHWQEKALTCRNSWGREWGKDGDFKLSLTHLNSLLSDGGVAAAVIE